MADRRGFLNHEQIAWQDSASARRVYEVDSSGNGWTTLNPLPVLLVSEPVPTATFIEYQTVSSVPTNTETTVLSFTVTGSSIRLSAIGGQGEAFAEWFIYINSVLKMKRRSGLTDLSVEIPMYEHKLSVGDILEVKVKHFELPTVDFTADVRYFT